MKEQKTKLQNAFDAVHAEPALKESTRAYVQNYTAKNRRNPLGGALRAAATLACMVLVFFVGYGSRMFFETVSVISIDINPSIELGLNAFDQVIQVEAFNEDGRVLTDSLQLRFLNYEEAVDRIVSSEKVANLLNQEEVLVIAVIGEDEIANEVLRSRLANYVSTVENTHCYSASLQDVEKAHECGLSYGKYLAYQKALEQREDLSAETVRDMTIKEIQEFAEEPCETESQHEQEAKHHAHEQKQHKNGHH